MSREKIRSGWILSPLGDVLIFLVPVLLGFAIWQVAESLGYVSEGRLPPAAFVLLIVGCDVAHVYATIYRAYLDKAALSERSGLLLGVPLGCFAAGVAVHSVSKDLFWTLLAYLAVWHFVQQQWGWVAYTRRNGLETSRVTYWIDRVVVWNATLFPILWWHTQLPREFHWFRDGDFLEGLPKIVGSLGLIAHFLVLGAYVAWVLVAAVRGFGVNRAKLLVISSTWLAWYGGIVHLNNDLAFTALNVLSHGVPYLVVVHRVERRKTLQLANWRARLFAPSMWPVYLGLLFFAGYLEETAWDRLVWRAYPELFFGAGVHLSSAMLSLVVPLLAMPQAAHYVLDGWLWRVRFDPALAAAMNGTKSS